MSDEARSSVAAFLSVHKGQEKGVSRLTSSSARQDHPYIDAAVELLEQAWVQVFAAQAADVEALLLIA